MHLSDALNRLPRVSLLDGPTPIQRLHRLEKALGPALGGVRLSVKRDDLTALGGGGNKLRKLEFLVGDARAQGADTIIAVGGVQSNFARLAAATAATQGMDCELVLAPLVPRAGDEYERNGNVLLDSLFGARLHVLAPGIDATGFAQDRAEALRRAGRVPYVATLGGSTPVGCLGYAACALEVQEQSRALGETFAGIVLPNGSSGTHAGLAAGLKALGDNPALVRGHSVLAPAEAARQATIDKGNATLDLLGVGARLDASDIDVSGDQRGEGYGIVTDAMVEAVRLVARQEGLLLDPVYSGKAFAGLLADVRSGRYRPGDHVLFLATGGVPGLYAYASAFLNG
ncbi:D-cysteine desulfhydrase family protein [Azospirillum rugosum]|uniref:D-cysteine desulfhydrase n=1 Tax=Azospirillum rugosum TaxID=416170 RepID=A0ABS4SSU8_9PROT|nr:D-cysteine desulfhydrase family protein [Azospirillum rugosum]MBP2295512.1 D-cysteine desulfhydrase [Azospirillum rugosum]MDQ0528391.1 D-cysteine desulfhydrase [Azospirillum rugosum]